MQCHVQLPHSCLYSMLYMSCERVLQMRLLGDGALRDALELRRVKLAIGKNIAKNTDTFSYIQYFDHFVGSNLNTVKCTSNY